MRNFLMAVCPGTVFRIGDFGARAPAPIDQKTKPATAGRTLETAQAVTANRGGAGSDPRLKSVNIVRKSSAQAKRKRSVNHQLTVPAQPRHDHLAVTSCAEHDHLAVTVSKREPPLIR